MLATLVAGTACGRVGYDPIVRMDAAGGGAGGGAGAAGAAGVGGGAGVGAVGGSTGGGAGVGAVGGSIGGGGGTAGAGGAAGGGGASGAAGADGGMVISCAPATYGTHSYLFCDALVDWATARAECETRGMRLVRLDDAGENTWLQATASFSASTFRREEIWLGGYEPTTDGDWHWTDGDAFWLGGTGGMAVGGLYTNWESGEPNNAVGPESCLAMPLNKTTWYDWGCADKLYFACELY